MPQDTVLVVDDSNTILKVVELVLGRLGYQVITARDGEEALAAAANQRPDLILLDFVMPRMNGYQLCRELGSRESLKDIPIVLMSAKGDQVGDRFVRVMGIVDYITKPFSPEAIAAVVQHNLAKYGKRPLEERTRPLVAPETPAESSDSSALGAAEELRRGVFQRVSDRLRTALAATAPSVTPEQVTSLLNETLLDDLVSLVPPGLVRGQSDSPPALWGDLDLVPLADILQLLGSQEQHGVLTLSRGKGRLEIALREGKIDLARATGAADEFLLGSFLLRSHAIDDVTLQGVLKDRDASSELLGQTLVRVGHVSKEALRAALRNQTRELIYEVLRWKFGQFSFRSTRDLPAAAADASLGLAIDELLLEGFRRVDEWHLIERAVGNFDDVFLRNDEAAAKLIAGPLTKDEQLVLDLVNGRNNVKDIVRQSKLGSYEVSRLLYRLLSVKVIRRRLHPVVV